MSDKDPNCPVDSKGISKFLEMNYPNRSEDYDWLTNLLSERYGKENIRYISSDFGSRFGVCVERRHESGDRKRNYFDIKEVNCFHRWKRDGEDGYMRECEDHPKEHEVHELNTDPDREKLVKWFISECDGIIPQEEEQVA